MVRRVNKRQLEVARETVNEEAKVLKRLKFAYGQAQDDCINKIIDLSKRRDMENLKSIIYQKKYQEALKKQIDGVLNNLNGRSFSTISEYLNLSYENGFLGTLYDLQGQGIPLCFPINQKEAAKAIQVDSQLSESMYARLGEDTSSLKKSIRAELSRGAANGESWNQIAGHIAIGMNSPFMRAYNNSVRIARTEGHRVQQEATLHCQQRARSKGANVVKQWDSTLDGATRPDHVALDGQIREVDKPFEVSGRKAMYPGAFGIASEDCNCRCCLLQRAKWALSDEDFTQMNGDTGELVKIQEKNYNSFKERYREEQKKLINDMDKKAVYDYMSAKSYVINDKLRNGTALNRSETEMMQRLDDALDKMPNFEGNLQRSVYFSNDKDIDEFMKQYIIGQEVKYKEYLSTTKGATYNPDAQVQIYIQDSKKGKNISDLNSAEQEVLYKRNTLFKVYNVVDLDGIHYILLREYDNE